LFSSDVVAMNGMFSTSENLTAKTTKDNYHPRNVQPQTAVQFPQKLAFVIPSTLLRTGPTEASTIDQLLALWESEGRNLSFIPAVCSPKVSRKRKDSSLRRLRSE
jgi:hypothetical protein